MAEYRLIGMGLSGSPIKAHLVASNFWEIKKKAKELAKEKKFKISKIEKKATFRFKVQKGKEDIITGEQKAYSQEEVKSALTKMGYKILRVERNLLDFKLPVPTKEIVIMIRICADLLKEKFPYNEILLLIQNDIEHKTLRQTVKEIYHDLKAGKEGAEVFGKHKKVLGTFTAYMLSVASTSGNMYEIYESTAKFLERQEEFKKNIRSAVLMPVIVLVACFLAIGFFIGFIFPKLTGMLIKYDIEIPPMTKATMAISTFLQENFFLLFIGIAGPLGLFLYFIRTPTGKYYFDYVLIKLPILGSLLHKTSIEIFCRVFYALYSGSSENINVIKVAAEACRNSYIETKIKDIAIPRMLKEGIGFVEALESIDVFPRNTLTRLRSGEESGTLRKTALQIANYYEKETTHKMRRVVDMINLGITLIVTLMIIGLTLVSSEIGFVSPTKHRFK